MFKPFHSLFLFTFSSDPSQYCPCSLSMQKEIQILYYKQGLYKAFALNISMFFFSVPFNPLVLQSIQDQIFFSFIFCGGRQLGPFSGTIHLILSKFTLDQWACCSCQHTEPDITSLTVERVLRT